VAPDIRTKTALLGAAKNIGQAVHQAIQAARNCCADPKNRNMHRELAVSYTQVGQAVTSLLDTCYAGVSGERECEETAYTLGRAIADLDASVLFAAVGAADTNEVTGGRTYEACHNDLITVAQQISKTTDQFQVATREGSQQIGAVALQLGDLGLKLAQHSKALGTLSGDKDTHLKLVDVCKLVESNMQQMVQTGKDAQNEPAMQPLVDEAAVSVRRAVDQLVSVTQAAAQEAAKGLMELDKLRALCQTLIDAYESPDFLGDTNADAQAIVRAARMLASATGELVVGCNAGQEEMVKACSATSVAVRRLFEAAKGSSSTTDRADVRKQLTSATRAMACNLQGLVDACKIGSKQKNLQAQAKVSQAARDCADRLLAIVSTANMLPGGEGLTLEEDTGEDLDQVAERELGACVLLIETVTKDLLSRPTSKAESEADISVYFFLGHTCCVH